MSTKLINNTIRLLCSVIFVVFFVRVGFSSPYSSDLHRAKQQEVVFSSEGLKPKGLESATLTHSVSIDQPLWMWSLMSQPIGSALKDHGVTCLNTHASVLVLEVNGHLVDSGKGNLPGYFYHEVVTKEAFNTQMIMSPKTPLWDATEEDTIGSAFLDLAADYLKVGENILEFDQHGVCWGQSTEKVPDIYGKITSEPSTYVTQDFLATGTLTLVIDSMDAVTAYTQPIKARANRYSNTEEARDKFHRQHKRNIVFFKKRHAEDIIAKSQIVDRASVGDEIYMTGYFAQAPHEAMLEDDIECSYDKKLLLKVQVNGHWLASPTTRDYDDTLIYYEFERPGYHELSGFDANLTQDDSRPIFTPTQKLSVGREFWIYASPYLKVGDNALHYAFHTACYGEGDESAEDADGEPKRKNGYYASTAPIAQGSLTFNIPTQVAFRKAIKTTADFILAKAKMNDSSLNEQVVTALADANWPYEIKRVAVTSRGWREQRHQTSGAAMYQYVTVEVVTLQKDGSCMKRDITVRRPAVGGHYDDSYVQLGGVFATEKTIPCGLVVE